MSRARRTTAVDGFWLWLAGALVIVVAGVTAGLTLPSGPAPAPPAPVQTPAVTDTYTVARVIDGDTLQLDDGRRVRLIGVDAPESDALKQRRQGDEECYGRQAGVFLFERLPPGSQVRLTPDPSQGDVDQYGRLLRYVQDPTTVSASDDQQWQDIGFLLIRQGYAREHAYDGPYELQTDYRNAQQAAQAQGAGGWTDCAATGGF